MINCFMNFSMASVIVVSFLTNNNGLQRVFYAAIMNMRGGVAQDFQVFNVFSSFSRLPNELFQATAD